MSGGGWTMIDGGNPEAELARAEPRLSESLPGGDVRDLAAALRRDPRWRDARDVRIEAAGEGFLRIRGSVERAPWRLFAKRTGRPEGAAHAYVSRRLPGAVPRYFGTVEVGGCRWLLMEDLTGRGLRSLGTLPGSESYPAFQHALGILARVHAASRADAARLLRRGVTARPLSSAAATAAIRGVPEHLALAGIFGVSLGEDVLGRVEQAIRSLAGEGPVSTPTPECLVHGDLQPNNVFAGPGEGTAVDVRVADWGEAAIECPQWDLAACGTAEVSFYLAAAESAGLVFGVDFWETLRRVVVTRMGLYLASSLGAVFRKSPATATSLLALIPAFVARLLEAAEASDYRGGLPLWERVGHDSR